MVPSGGRWIELHLGRVERIDPARPPVRHRVHPPELPLLLEQGRTQLRDDQQAQLQAIDGTTPSGCSSIAGISTSGGEALVARRGEQEAEVALQIERAVGCAQHDAAAARSPCSRTLPTWHSPQFRPTRGNPTVSHRQADRHRPAGLLDEAEGGIVRLLRDRSGRRTPRAARRHTAYGKPLVASTPTDPYLKYSTSDRYGRGSSRSSLYQATAPSSTRTTGTPRSSGTRGERFIRLRPVPAERAPCRRIAPQTDQQDQLDDAERRIADAEPTKPSGMKPSHTPMKNVLAGTSRPTISSQAFASIAERIVRRRDVEAAQNDQQDRVVVDPDRRRYRAQPEHVEQARRC